MLQYKYYYASAKGACTMGFSPGVSNLPSLSDVLFNNPATGNYLGYNTSTSKWENRVLGGVAALANGGGSETVSTNATTTGAVTLNLANGNVFNLTLTGNVTFTFSGATNGKACAFSAYIKQDGTGNRTITWPTSVKWAGGIDPTSTTTAGSIDIFVFETLDGGTTWFGSLVGANFS
jgi:hypothetical protein